MKDKKNIFDVNPSEEHVARINKAVTHLLRTKRIEEKRKFLAWILTPAFASFVAFHVWKRKSKSTDSLMAGHEFLLEIENEEDLDLMTDLELFEELDQLDKMEI